MGINNKQSNYAEILDIIEKMKADVVSSCTAQLMLTGTMPVSAQNELKVLSQITGAVFNGIITLGVEAFEDENNEGLVYTNIGGKKYSCAKINISNSVSISSNPLSASEAYSMASTVEESEEKDNSSSKKVSIEEFKTEQPVVAPSKEPIFESKKESVKEEPLEPVVSSTPSFMQLDEASEFGDNLKEEASVEVDNNTQFDETPMEEKEDVPMQEQGSVVEEDTKDDDLSDDDDFETSPVSQQNTTTTSNNRDEIDDLLDDDDWGESTPSNYQSKYEEEPEVEPEVEEVVTPLVKEEVPEPVKDAVVSTFKREGMFVEESQKAIGEMVYSMSKLNLSHIGGGRPEEIIVMIAPLKMSRVSCPAVPIVVALYNRGKVICKSSFDMGDGGKAIVQVEINEFHFLCRGSFDENGKFNAFITTTGISSQQGDRINVVSHKSYGNSQLPETKNGHVKVKYDSESGEGTIEVFPFGTEEDDEFIVLVKNPEFCDVYYLSKAGRGGSVAKVYGQNGVLEVVPSWNGDILELEVFEQ